MKKRFSTEAKVGAFVLLALLALAYITVDVSRLGFTPGGTYKVYVMMDNAEGVTYKTPVQIAGIPVGVVSGVELTDDQKARVEIELKKGVAIDKDAAAEIRTRGVLGDTYIEITPSKEIKEVVSEGGTVTRVKPAPDLQQLARDVTLLTEDLQAITKSLRTYTEGERSSMAKILHNMETLTKNLSDVSQNSQRNTEELIDNLAAISREMRSFSVTGRRDIEQVLDTMTRVTQDIEAGRGNVGRLFKDETLYEQGEEILANVSDLTKSVRTFQAGVDYRLEYLGKQSQVKNYVNLKLSVNPDKYFLFGITTDQNPPPRTVNEVETIDIEGVTSVVSREIQKQNKTRYNAQLAKRFGDITVRGGLMETTGGVALDYEKGPFLVSAEAFRFGDFGPNIKVRGQLNLTPSFFITVGGDDLLSRWQGADWFVGAGIQFTDEDISSLFGGASLLVR